MENDENKDLLLEEISEYYSSEATDDDIIAEQPENEPEPKIITANHTDDEDEQPEDAENTDEYDESDNNADCSGNSKMFFIVSAAVALSVLLSVFFAGILSYKDEEDINYRFSHIQTSSTISSHETYWPILITKTSASFLILSNKGLSTRLYCWIIPSLYFFSTLGL